MLLRIAGAVFAIKLVIVSLCLIGPTHLGCLVDILLNVFDDTMLLHVLHKVRLSAISWLSYCRVLNF